MTPNRRLLTLKNVAERLGIKEQSLRRRIHDGKIGTLPIFQTGDGPKAHWACREEDLEAWIQARKGVA
ncbi:MAG: helix-turn-helix domain-containing protein [Nitrospirota bacterium]|nr:helix-turn-helix domain-containing protein [Nitrospirota bacterium]